MFIAHKDYRIGTYIVKSGTNWIKLYWKKYCCLLVCFHAYGSFLFGMCEATVRDLLRLTTAWGVQAILVYMYLLTRLNSCTSSTFREDKTLFSRINNYFNGTELESSVNSTHLKCSRLCARSFRCDVFRFIHGTCLLYGHAADTSAFDNQHNSTCYIKSYEVSFIYLLT